MWQRAIRSRSFGNLVIKDAALGDIFIMKLIANRSGDAPDCAALVSGVRLRCGLQGDRGAVPHKAGEELEQKIWITYIDEGIGRLEEEYELKIPIADRVLKLADEYRERLYQDLTSEDS